MAIYTSAYTQPQIDEAVRRVLSGRTSDGERQVTLVQGESFASQVTEANTEYIVKYDFNLGGASVSMPSNSILTLKGGIISNGTIVCDNTFINGFKGLNKDIVLSGTLRGDAVQFDWFVNEVVSKSDYTTFLANGYLTGTVPTISNTNRTILTMLMNVAKTIEFGKGIYPFDAQMNILPSIKGQGIHDTLLWAPASSMFYCSTVGSMEVRMSNLAIEADGYVVYLENTSQYTLSHHHLFIDSASLMSYNQDCMYKDNSGNLFVVYDMNISNTIMACGPDKVIINGFNSSSNEFHDLSDANWFFDTGVVNNKRGKSTAFFKDTSMQICEGFNIVYKGLKYFAVITSDALYMNISDCNFEYTSSDAQNLQYIFYCDGGSNNIVKLRNINYIGSPTGGYHFYGNSEITNLHIDSDSDVYIYNCSLRVSSGFGKVYCITKPLDSQGRKRRLYVAEPGSNYNDSTNSPTKDEFTAKADVDSLYGFPTFMKTAFNEHLTEGSFTDFYLTLRAPKDRSFYHPKSKAIVKWNSAGNSLQEIPSNYSELEYSVNTVTANGAISLDGTIPLHVVTLSGDATSVTLSTNPAAGHSCHVIFTAANEQTVTITHDATNRVCPNGTDPDPLTVPAGGYVEIDFLKAGNKVYLRGI